ncbi:hypothetical protein B296_00040071 [Ensete ventricosum]|uniref:Uncharacterized protein n=1 Tax=Ensete ventricosum TaxID=4639 RepID=A0A426X3K4_ENSVE|nr:hypothetical protein B296_00040071 [Ensete ventricosum]
MSAQYVRLGLTRIRKFVRINFRKEKGVELRESLRSCTPGFTWVNNVDHTCDRSRSWNEMEANMTVCAAVALSYYRYDFK